MKVDHRHREASWTTEHRHDMWPRGCDTDADGALTLHGVRLDSLAAAWGTPLWVVDEPAFMHGVDELIQIRGARPLFGAGHWPCRRPAGRRRGAGTCGAIAPSWRTPSC